VANLRWRSKRAWIATFGLVLFVVKTYTEIEIKDADELLDLLLLVGAAWGIFDKEE
jgi:hypothetical protein